MAKRNSGTTWIFLIIIVAAGAAVYFLYPDKIKGMFGEKEKPTQVQPVKPGEKPDKPVQKPPEPDTTQWGKALTDGDYDKALAMVKNGLEEKKIKNVPAALLVAGKAASAANKSEAAAGYLNQVLTEHPQSLEAPEAMAELMKLRFDTGKLPDFFTLLQTAAKKYPAHHATGKVCAQIAPKLYARYKSDKSQWWNVRLAYALAYNSAADKSDKKKYTTVLKELNDYLIFSPAHIKAFPIHQVAPGENLKSIGKKYNCTAELIQQINNIKDPKKLQVGDRLKIITGTASVVVSKKNFSLVLLLDKLFVREYPVGIGKMNKTPEGEFKVTTRDIEPNWFFNGERIPYGDDRNLLGTRWIGLSIKSYGIHGTWKPKTIGEASSNGCIRMLNKHVEELYRFLQTGDTVVIK